MSEEALAQYVELNRRLGGDLRLAQGSGGNTSYKPDGRTLWMKATGVPLSAVSPTGGWVGLRLAELRAGLDRLWTVTDEDARQTGYRSLLAACRESPGPAASIETSLHALLPDPWIAHVHSLAGQILGQLDEREAAALAAQAAGPSTDIRFVPPRAPGHDLGKEIARSLASRPLDASPSGRCGLWVLRNHGLAWTASAPETLIAASERFESTLRRRFDLDRFPFRPSASINPGEGPRPAPPGRRWARIDYGDWPSCRFDERPLFPDFAARFQGGTEGNLSVVDGRTAYFLTAQGSPRASEEVIYAQAVVSTVAEERGGRRPLDAETTATIVRYVLEPGSGGGY